MFRDNEKNQQLVMKALQEAGSRISLIETLPLTLLAGEATKHIDNQDECSVTVRSSKEHGIQFFYTGCEVHAMLLASLLSVHQQKVVDKKQFAGLENKTCLEAKILLIRLAQIVDGDIDLALSIQSKPEPPKKGE